jgi:hypothetical protein
MCIGDGAQLDLLPTLMMAIVDMFDARRLHVRVEEQGQRGHVVALDENRTGVGMSEVGNNLAQPHRFQTPSIRCHILGFACGAGNCGLQSGLPAYGSAIQGEEHTSSTPGVTGIAHKI